MGTGTQKFFPPFDQTQHPKTGARVSLAKAHELFFNVICKDLPFQIKVKLWGYFLHKNHGQFSNAPSDYLERLMIERLGMDIDSLPHESEDYEAVCVFCYTNNNIGQELCSRCLRNLYKPVLTYLCHECGLLLRGSRCTEVTPYTSSSDNSDFSSSDNSDSEEYLKPCDIFETLTCKNSFKRKILDCERFRKKLKIRDDRSLKYNELKLGERGYQNLSNVCRRDMKKICKSLSSSTPDSDSVDDSLS